MKKFVIILITIIVLILAGGAFYALYYLPNIENNTDNTDDIKISQTPEVSQVTTPLPEVTNVGTSVLPKGVVYIDTNLNNQKDSGEGQCIYCYARALVCSADSSNYAPKLENIINIQIGTKGEVPIEKLKEGYVCWASYEDRKVIMPFYTISGGDGVQDMNIPVQPIVATISGVNTHIVQITKMSSNEYLYVFDLLIPILKTEFTAGKPIWVKFAPDSTKPDSYFLKAGVIHLDSDGSITDIPNSYYMTIDWRFSESYPGATQVEGYTLIM